MIKRMNIKKHFAILISLSLAFSMTACGKKKVDYVEPELDTTEPLQESDLGIPDTLNYELTSSNGNSIVKVDAKVIYNPNLDGLPVVKVSPKPFEEEELQQYADRIFDEGTAELWQDEYHLNMDALLERQEKLEAEIAEYSGEDEYMEYLTYHKMITDEAIEEYEDSDDKIAGDKAEWVYFKYENEDGDIVTSDLGYCNFRGSIDGKPGYILSFEKIGDDSSMSLSYLRDTGGEYQATPPDSPLSPNGNACKYTKEEAESLAVDFVNKMGISDFAVTKTLDGKRSMYIAGKNEVETIVDGYLICFGRSVKGVSTMYSNNHYNGLGVQYFDAEGNLIDSEYGYEYIEVCVTDDGIIDMQYAYPMQVDEIHTENSVLLPFENIDQCAQEYMQRKYVKDEYYSTMQINEVELGLDRVKGDDGSYFLIPVWAYYYVNSGIDYSRFEQVRINAIDGSIIGDPTDEAAGSFVVF